MVALQIIAQTVEDARAAETGGASNLEVTVDLAVGGLTPPLTLVREIRDAVKIDLHGMVRPHARDFVYSPPEIEAILAQVCQFKALGVQGIVFGALTAESLLDTQLIWRIAEAASPLEITLHRAIDESCAPEAGLATLKGVVSRVLTSGGAPSAWEGRETIRRWVQTYAETFQFICGAGVNHANLEALIQATGAPEYHVGSGAQTEGRVDRQKVRQLVEILARF
jgi:copper homeostasis protein